MGSDSDYIIVGSLFVVTLLVLFPFALLSSFSISRSRISNVRVLSVSGASFTHLAERILSNLSYYTLSMNLFLLITALYVGWGGMETAKALYVFFSASETGAAGAAFGLEAHFAAFILLAFVSFGVVQLCRVIAAANPEGVLCWSSLGIIGISKVLFPLTALLTWVGNLLVRVVGFKGSLEISRAVSPEELSDLVECSTEIEEDERELLQGVVTFTDTVVQEVMTPRTDIISVSESASLSEIVQKFRENGLSRIVVTGGELDDVKGILLAKDLLQFVESENGKFCLRDLIRVPYFIPWTKKIDDLLQDFRRKAEHMAIVLDEHGGVDGLVTLEDLLEEIVGEIFDEYDEPSEEVDEAQETEAGDLVVDGGMPVEDLNEEYGFNFPPGEYNTFAGYIFHVLGRIPRPGEVVQSAGAYIRVEDVQNHRIIRLRILNRNAGEPCIKDSESFEQASESN